MPTLTRANAAPDYARSADREILGAVPMGIAAYDRRLRLIYFNPAWAALMRQRLDTAERDIALGAYLPNLIALADNVLDLYERALAGEVVHTTSVPGDGEGAACWDVTLSPLTRDGEITGVVETVLDVTEREQARRNLEQLIEEQKREADRQRQVAESQREILAVLNSNRSLEDTLGHIVGQAGRLLGTSSAAIFRLQPDGKRLVVQAALGLSDEYVASVSVPVGAGAIGQAVQQRRPIPVTDTGPLLSFHMQMPEVELNETGRTQLAALLTRYGAILSVPLIVKDEVYGGISLYYDKPRDFSGEELELASAFGDQAALAIENARLRERAEQIAVAAERSRLARDLHDSVTQTLFSASLISELLPGLIERNPDEARRRLEELKELTRGALAEMRMLLLELRPAALTEVSLGDLLRQLAEATTGRARLPVAVTIKGEFSLPPDTQIALYRIAQEALNNVARHSGATEAGVALECAGYGKLQIYDNGRGFDAARVSPQHLGLDIMRERAEAISAHLQIESSPGRGTKVEVAWSCVQARTDKKQKLGKVRLNGE